MNSEEPHSSRSDAGDTLKPFSCSACRQRKVRCDRAWPCGNCARADAACEYVAPVRGKRGPKGKPRQEGPHAKMRRYEEMMLWSQAADGGVTAATDGAPGIALSQASTAASPASYAGLEPLVMEALASSSKMTGGHVSSRFYRRVFLSTSHCGIAGLTDSIFAARQVHPLATMQFRHPDEFAPPQDVDGNGEAGVALLLGPSLSGGSLASPARNHHPSLSCLHSLRQIFIDRIDPLAKVMHMPSFWVSTMEAARGQSETPPDTEAAIFCFYTATISVLEETECQKLFQGGKRAVFGRYWAVARHALGRARLLTTSSLMTLRAFFLFMIALRGHLRYDSQYILCGIAIRLAQKMGLDRDGRCLGLSLFEMEMRRRLWWHAVHLDSRTAELVGMRPSHDVHVGDVGKPRNVEDADLDPAMIEPPIERKAITPITVCLVRCDLSRYKRHLFGGSQDGSSCGVSGAELSLATAEKAKAIDEMEEELEMRYIRYCDPSRPLDLLVSSMIRAAICNMRLSAHNPRGFGSCSGQISEVDRRIAFRNAVKLLEYASLVGENKSLQRYAWRINTTYMWDKIIYVLIEAEHQRLGPDVDRLWELMGIIFAQHPDALAETAATAAVYSALSKSALQVWDGYVAARRAEGLIEAEEPEYIGIMRGRPCAADDTRQGRMERPDHQQHAAQAGSMEAGYGFPPLESPELSVEEAGGWEQLVSEANSFHFVPGY